MSGAVATEIRLEGGFKPGQIYQLTYTARDPIVVALGMAGIRDLLSYLRDHPLAGQPPPQKRVIFGISQSGRLIKTMLLRGLHVDEDGTPAFDGAFIHVAGGGKGGFDYRFAMPTRHFSVLEDHIYPTDFFPFATVAARDAVTGAEGSLLIGPARSAPSEALFVNTSSEYWNRAASLIGTDPAGERDLPPAPEARVYLIAGAQHYVGGLRERAIFANCVNTLNHYRVMRALMVRFERWVRDAAEPPPSAHPRIADGTLVTVAGYKAAFPRLPEFRLPESNLRRRASTSAAGLKPNASPSRCRRYGQAVRGAGAQAGRRRQRPGRHPAAGNAGAARHPHRLQPAQRRDRLPLGHRPLGWLVRAVRAQRGQARRRRSAPPARRALWQSRRLRAEAARGGCKRRRPGLPCCRRRSMRW